MEPILSSCLLLPAHPPGTVLPELWSQGYSLENSLSFPQRLVGGMTPEGLVLGLSPLVVATGRLQPPGSGVTALPVTALGQEATAC